MVNRFAEIRISDRVVETLKVWQSDNVQEEQSKLYEMRLMGIKAGKMAGTRNDTDDY